MNLKTVKRDLKLRPEILAVILWFAAAAWVNAAFEETSVSAKAAALGGIYVSACDDVSAIYHNPAGLELIPSAEFIAQYSKLYVGLTDNSDLGYSFFGVAQPLKNNYGTLGFGWLRFALAGLYTEDTFIISYAREASFIKRGLNLGVNLKYLKLGYGQDQYTMNALDNNGNATGLPDSLFATYGNTKNNFDLDLAAQYMPAANYKIGLMIENLFEPNLALQPGVSSPLYSVYKLGVTHTGKTSAVLVDFMSKGYSGGTDWEAAPAGEKMISDNVALRGALNIGSRQLVNVSCGIGYKIDNFQVDYAMVYPLSGIQGTLGNQRISVLIHFGPVIRRSESADELIAKYEAEKQAHLLTMKKLQEVNIELEKLRRDLDEQLSKPEPVVPVVDNTYKAAVTAPADVSGAKQIINSTATVGVTAQTQAQALAEEYSMVLYQYRKAAAEMSIPQRLLKIEAIIKKFGSAMKVTDAVQERTTLLNEQKAQAKYFKDSLDYYRNMANYGIKTEEKVDILKRMINKYKAIGVDVSEAQDEMDKIQGK